MKVERIQVPLPIYTRKQLKQSLHSEVEVETINAVDPDAESKERENKNKQSFQNKNEQTDSTAEEKPAGINIVV